LSDASDLVNTSFARSYTHHQKSVVLDEPSKIGGQSTLVAYLGGIDLTDGRFSAQILLRPTSLGKVEMILSLGNGAQKTRKKLTNFSFVCIYVGRK